MDALPGSVHKNTRWIRRTGARNLLCWLENFPGETWQQRWQCSPADNGPGSWHDLLAAWLLEQGVSPGQPGARKAGALALVRADVIRPSLPWLMSSKSQHLREAAAYRDPDGFATLAAAVGVDFWKEPLAMRAAHQLAMLILSKGGKINDITVGDCLELNALEARHYQRTGGRTLFYAWLRDLQNFPEDAPATLRGFSKHAGQVGVAELVDRYQLQCRPVRDVLVDYLAERESALDYSSLNQLSRNLAKHFWADLEQHHPGINSFHLAPEVCSAWKQRARVKKSLRRMPGRLQVPWLCWLLL
ncbi:hypothetical protein OG512_00395 [Streptomyces sp. NBC_01378]|uniref:hypothetical protein n=1 Tax=Streptomyces sp. NBC_01378 TaxID=2903844 RepID=UPI0032460E86